MQNEFLGRQLNKSHISFNYSTKEKNNEKQMCTIITTNLNQL